MKEIDNNEYHYDAFISYRHTYPDKFIAEHLHKELETYKLPANVKKMLKKTYPDARTNISRVFRDEEELPLASSLEDPIVRALKNSDWLIVICSPRLKESKWCIKEIETFSEIHGTDNILAVLVEGEPEDAFPEELLKRKIKIVRPDGKDEIVEQKVEPLAADFRADNDRGRLKKIKEEKLRLLAPIFGLNFDDLRQRHRERKVRKVILGTILAAIVSVIFGIVGIMVAVEMTAQRNQIKEQSDKISEQALKMAAQAEEISEQNEFFRLTQAENLAEKSMNAMDEDDRMLALQYAYQAATEYEDIEMPRTDMAMLALTNALQPYNLGKNLVPISQIGTLGCVRYITSSPSAAQAAVYDDSGSVTFWNTKTGQKTGILRLDRELIDPMFECCFIDDDRFVCFSGDNLIVYIISTSETIVIDESDILSLDQLVRYDSENDRLYVINRENAIMIYSGYDYSLIKKIDTGDSYKTNVGLRCFSEGLVYAYTINDYSTGTATTYVDVIDYETGEITFSVEMDVNYYKTSYIYDDVLYVVGIKYLYSYYTETYTDAFDMTTGELLWEYSDQNFFGDKMTISTENAEVTLVEIGNRGLIEFDLKTGEVLTEYTVSGEVIWCGFSGSHVCMITSAGTRFLLIDHSVSGMPWIYSCIGNIDYMDMGNGVVMCAEDTNNKVIVYGYMDNSNISEYTGTYTRPENQSILIENLDDDIAARIENRELVTYCVYDDKEEYLCVSYVNGTAVIYEVSSMEQVGSFEIYTYYPVLRYFGKDKDGNTYWGSSYDGYCLSEDFNLIANIDDLYGMDAEENMLILGIEGNTLYCSEIYDFDDLVEKAGKIVN